MYAHTEDIFKLPNSHSQDLTFNDVEIRKQNTVEESAEGAEPGVCARRSTMMVLK